jgi:probable rRNA maturation factor
MAGLNATYRGETSATDVLAFPMGEGRFHDLNRGLLGDVVISVETARRQSRPDHGGLRAELALLLVHGILHLFGYHHGDARNRRHMWRRQRAILSSCGIQVTAAARRHRSGGRSGAGTPKRDAGLEAAGR